MTKMKEKVMNLIIDEACGLFVSRPISSVSMEEIAETAGIGAASLYRYFGTKVNIVLRCAVSMGERVLKDYFTFQDTGTGYELISSFYMAFFEIFHKEKGYFRFVEDLDAMLASESPSEKNQYEDMVEAFHASFISLYSKGIQDSSIRALDNPDVFYYSTTHALLNLCKKLACTRALIRQDVEARDEDELLTLINIILFSLKTN